MENNMQKRYRGFRPNFPLLKTIDCAHSVSTGDPVATTEISTGPAARATLQVTQDKFGATHTTVTDGILSLEVHKNAAHMVTSSHVTASNAIDLQVPKGELQHLVDKSVRAGEGAAKACNAEFAMQNGDPPSGISVQPEQASKEPTAGTNSIPAPPTQKLEHRGGRPFFSSKLLSPVP
jgi:hypothetical protein